MMCDFNSGCPGHEVADGFVPCESADTCASGQVADDAMPELRQLMANDQTGIRETLMAIIEEDFDD
jgi:hypothetical protein